MRRRSATRERDTRRARSSAATTRRSSIATVRESEAARRTLPVQRDLRYGAAPRALIDYFPAPASARRARTARLLPRRLLAGAVEGGVRVPRAGVARGRLRARGRRLHAGARGAPARRSSPSAARRWRGCTRSATRWASTPAASSLAGSSAGAYLAAACADAVAGAAARHRAGLRHLRRGAAASAPRSTTRSGSTRRPPRRSIC